jgi:hypothetical protein
MSEEMNMPRGGFRKQLLATASALALLGSAYSARAADNDSDRPQVWIELGGQLDRLSGEPQIFSPQFFSLASPTNLSPLVDSQQLPPFSIGEEGKISFEPSGTDWILTAAIRYGRSHAARHLHAQTAGLDLGKIYVAGLISESNVLAQTKAFGDGQTILSESHLVLDFQAGKDVGLGMFGAGGTSVVSAGIRFAQFTSGSGGTFHARPVFGANFITKPGKYRLAEEFKATYTAVSRANRSTLAIGPSVSWDASLPVAGNPSDKTINFDWGVNAAVQFGRQRAQVHHQTTGYHYHKYGGIGGIKKTGSYTTAPPDQNRSRAIAIPNVGGFAGLSFRYPNARLSIGYRADFFFGAMDGGIDTRKSENVSFYGPFASVSVGLGG